MKQLLVILVSALLMTSCAGQGVKSKLFFKQYSQEEILLTPENTVNIVGNIDYNSMHQAEKDILDLREKHPNDIIYLVMKSGGGDVPSGMDFQRFLDSQSNIKTITIFAASMASGIVESNKGERLIVEDGILMFHRATVGIRGTVNDGEVETQLDLIKQVIDILEERNYSRIGISKEDYKNRVKDNWWEVGFNAVKENLADGVVKIKCSKELEKLVKEVTFESFFGSRTVKINQCPLID